MKTIKTIITMILCAILYIPALIWVLILFMRKKNLDVSMIDATDKQHRINRAEYFRGNVH